MTKLKVTDTIKAAGSVSAFSKAIKLPRTTVAYWCESDRIPAWREDAFKAAAKKLGIDPAKPTKAEARV